MFYAISLIFISVSVSCYLVFHNLISVLVSIMFVIVYVGAIIILVGYICAVTPNLYLEPDYSLFSLFMCFLGIFWSLNSAFGSYSKSINLVDFYYSAYGLFIFSFLVFCLFMVLLMVTTHDNSPRGPFRSLL